MIRSHPESAVSPSGLGWAGKHLLTQSGFKGLRPQLVDIFHRKAHEGSEFCLFWEQRVSWIKVAPYSDQTWEGGKDGPHRERASSVEPRRLALVIPHRGLVVID